ncbi:heme ABC transporter ATP-binding protein [Roseovarius aestuarii]|nr:heme ABC transporter ATP-binding protein [Roseovarius aestuarii]
MLTVAELSLERSGRQILDGIDLTLEAGRFLALVGPNGAGKSTLLSAIAGRETPSGSVAWFGRDLGDWTRRDLARQGAVMQQSETTAFDFLVREYVALGRLPRQGMVSDVQEQQILAAAMAALDLSELADRTMPSLSGGERQRCRMARCLAQLWDAPENPPGAGCFLLLDEPTSALDLGQQARLLCEAWAFVRRGGSCIAVLHDLNLAATYADEVAVLVRGRIVARGTPSEIVTANRVSGWYDARLIAGTVTDGPIQRELISLPVPRG